MARENDVQGLLPIPVTVAATGASAMWMGATAGQVGWQFKYFSGGSLEIHAAPLGSTSGSALPSGSSGYLMSTTELFSVTGPARFFFVATGSNAVAHVVRSMGPGF